MTQRIKLFEGANKILYESADVHQGILHFKDSGLTPDSVIKGKGMINNRLSETLMQRLNLVGIQTHWLKSLGLKEQLIKLVDVLPFYLVMRNWATGDFAKNLELNDGELLPRPITEFYAKTAHTAHPLINQDHILAFAWCAPQELEEIIALAQRINDFLVGQFSALQLELMNVTLKFGRYYPNLEEEFQLVLCDDISLDSCDVRDMRTKEIFGRIGCTEDQTAEQKSQKYETIAHRFGIISEMGRIEQEPLKQVIRPIPSMPVALTLVSDQE